VLSHIVANILQDHYQGLSQTSLTNGLSQALFTSVVEQARLCNLLVDHTKKKQLNTSDSLLPPSKLPMDLTKEEGRAGTTNEHFPKWILVSGELPARNFVLARANKGTTTAKSHVNKLRRLRNSRPAFSTIVDNPGITPRNA
jgi:hypothetical protein